MPLNRKQVHPVQEENQRAGQLFWAFQGHHPWKNLGNFIPFLSLGPQEHRTGTGDCPNGGWLQLKLHQGGRESPPKVFRILPTPSSLAGLAFSPQALITSDKIFIFLFCSLLFLKNFEHYLTHRSTDMLIIIIINIGLKEL